MRAWAEAQAPAAMDSAEEPPCGLFHLAQRDGARGVISEPGRGH